VADGYHLENRRNCNISKTVWPILTKFCLVVHTGPLGHNGSSQIQIFKNPRQWMAAILKTVKRNIFATN